MEKDTEKITTKKTTSAMTRLTLLNIHRRSMPVSFLKVFRPAHFLSSGDLRAPLVAEAPDGGDIGGVGRVVLDLDAKAADVHIHDFEFTVVIPAPDCRENILPGEGAAGVLHEELHDGILHLGELDPAAGLVQGAIAGVEDKG